MRGCPVPINHRLTADGAAYILDDSDAVLAFAGDAILAVVERYGHACRGYAIGSCSVSSAARGRAISGGHRDPVEVDVGESLGGSICVESGFGVLGCDGGVSRSGGINAPKHSGPPCCGVGGRLIQVVSKSFSHLVAAPPWI